MSGTVLFSPVDKLSKWQKTDCAARIMIAFVFLPIMKLKKYMLCLKGTDMWVSILLL